ncbi:hypothetical protein CK203_094355 [Vitis vinifera]|uniref:Uncharacterized protein n=1 Tax=Vitis vinifera TaxID=29760 RepID=A0A438CWB4_VITVI|nr:hypothetical protein CK203_094355 [Vitis vinifera]
MKALSSLLVRAREGGFLSGFKIKSPIYTGSSCGLKLFQGEMIPIGSMVNLEVLALEIGCKVGELSSSYLGLPLRPLTVKGIVWKKVIKGKYGEEEGGWSFCERVKFWRNSWCSQEPFKVMFPILFALFKAKEAWVPDLWEQRERGGVWNFHLLEIQMIGSWILWRGPFFNSKVIG